MIELLPVLIKISSKRNSSGGINWSVGISRKLYGLLPEYAHRVQIDNSSSFNLTFGNKGSLLGDNANCFWATLSRPSLINFAMPQETMKSIEFPGVYDSEANRVSFPEVQFPKIIQDIIEGKQYIPLVTKVTEMPVQDHTTSANTDAVTPVNAKPVLVKSSSITVPTPLSLSEQVEKLTLEDLQKLNSLIKQVQLQRKDIVFVIQDGIAVMKRKVLADV